MNLIGLFTVAAAAAASEWLKCEMIEFNFRSMFLEKYGLIRARKEKKNQSFSTNHLAFTLRERVCQEN